MKKIGHVDNIVLYRVYRSVFTDPQSKEILSSFGTSQSRNVRAGAGLKGVLLQAA
jgi:hypothetical protein